jgi:murein DD-endopeptidase MepM/ murein hydrolase activator NlpD
VTHRKRSFHGGLDLAAPEGTDVVAVAPGRVVQAGPLGRRNNYGYAVTIEHDDGLRSRYAHLCCGKGRRLKKSSILVSTGDRVYAGQVIAKTGGTGRVTGPHLHFEARSPRRSLNPHLLLGSVQSCRYSGLGGR